MRPSMTSGAERPPNGAVQTTLPFSFCAGSKLSGRPVSSEWPFWFGPRQWIQSAEFTTETTENTESRARQNGRNGEGSIENSGFELVVFSLRSLFSLPPRGGNLCGESSSLLVNDAAGFHLEPRQRTGRG